MGRSLGRFGWFLLASAGLIGATVVASGLLVGSFFERHVLAHEEAHAVEVVRNQARQHLAPEDFRAGTPDSGNFRAFLEGLPGVFRIKVFDPTGRIVWSNEPRLIGLIFPDNPYLAAALAGRVTTVLEAPRRSEHVFERGWEYVAEAYIPIALGGSDVTTGVVETYRDMSAVVQDIRRTQRRLWAVAGGIGLVLYAALALAVWKASASEQRAIRRLEQQNRELVLLQGFTQSVLRPVAVDELAAAVVENAGAGLRLARAALYRVETGAAPTLLAQWPPAPVPEPLPGPLVTEALARRTWVVRGPTVALAMIAQRGPAHLFVGETGAGAAPPLRTLEIMLHEAAAALANVELFTEIREAHERLAAILSGVADRMVIIDRAMRIVWANEAAVAALGPGAVGRTCFEVMQAGPASCEGCPAVRTLHRGTVERGVQAMPGPGGGTRYLDLVTAPLRDASGEVYQVLEVARDITELVDMEERLKRTNEALLDAQARLVEQERLAAVGQVVVGLHHAILNPLTGVLGALQVLRRVSPTAPEHGQAIAEAEEQIRKIERLVRRLPALQRVHEAPYVGGTTMLDLDRSCAGDEPSPENPEHPG